MHVKMSLKRQIQLDITVDMELSRASNFTQMISQVAFRVLTLKLGQSTTKSIDQVMPLIQDFQNTVTIL